MRLTLCALLFLLPLPATAATLCDGLAAELKRGTVAPSHVLRQLADRSGSHIVIADASETVPPAYQLEAFGPARLSQLDDGTVALVSTQEGALCQQWAFFERRNGGIWRVKNPPGLQAARLCRNRYAQAVRIGDVAAMVVEQDGSNSVVLEATPWQGRTQI